MHSLSHSIALVLLVFFSAISLPSSQALRDRDALLSFKSQLTSDPSSSLSSWNQSSTSPCNWEGVLCNSRLRVSALDLQGLGLSGPISPNLGNLSFLHSLCVQNNRFTSPLPAEMGNLRRLRVLNISSNSVVGVIPLNLTRCLELTSLDMADNKIYGPIPSEIERLSKLQVINLGHNSLTGMIPPSIGNLSSLTSLDLGTNNLTGAIPDSLGHMPSLKHLQISINNLVGTVPQSLYNSSSLVTFAIASNQLWGEIPSDVGFTLPNLRTFHCCINHFTGPIPLSLNNITNINSIRMSHNSFTGTLPLGALANLPDLTMYNIGYNQIIASSSDIIESLTNSTKLQFLAIDEISLEGTIPESTGNLSTRLAKIYMGGGRVHGTIPPSIGRLGSLTLLNLSHNSISGEIPSEIGQLKQLQMLGLASNKIVGEIPVTIGNLINLSKLELSGNHLAGTIPSTFGKNQRLLSLDLSNNQLDGSIPIELLGITSLTSVLNLSMNSITGALPQEIGGLIHVAAIDFSHNHLSGSIPESISNCKSLQSLSMSSNLLSGDIPGALGKLTGLQSLDLSSNQLFGSIPVDLGNLNALQFLNLSFNNLEGEIPKEGIFKNLSSVYLQGNARLCALSTSGCKKAKHRSALRIALLAFGCMSSLAIIAVLGLLLFRWRKHGADVPEQMIKCPQHPMISYAELLRATENFSPMNLIGRGGFGSIYKGTLANGMASAIKVLDLGKVGAVKSFVAECEALRRIRHRNLVKLITSCSGSDFANNDFYALVYEFMENGSLEDWLRGRRSSCQDNSNNIKGLAVLERLKVAIDVASAVNYLHHGCEVPVVHGDLKPSNVLLDKEMVAKVGDFGLAKLMMMEKNGDEQSLSTTRGIKGSIGYIPPEYGLGGKRSTRADVYSYGILLLELITGKGPTHEGFQGEETLQKWVASAFPSKLMEIIDPALLAQVEGCVSYEGHQIRSLSQQECLASIIEIGLSCAVESPEARNSMQNALNKLQDIKRNIFLKVQLKSGQERE